MKLSIRLTVRVFFAIVLVLLLLIIAAFPVMAKSSQDTAPGVMFEPAPDVLALIAGVVLTLAFSYIPGLNVKFAALDPTVKRLIMLGLLTLTALAIFGLSCASVITGVTCDRAGIEQMVKILILAIVANQSVYQISPQNNAVEAAKSARWTGYPH